ncbi:MAG: endonuclease/exonuclease/phosphatase family protein [Bifidobacteriaceae bacterium]|jgi:endonuclease/exonuclease/phosphatase family metal-dependent hydrolase|nr:endonuclease/exonuclease/phosphatase family protein [Bifidobacteriaceae bacterium]
MTSLRTSIQQIVLMGVLAAAIGFTGAVSADATEPRPDNEAGTYRIVTYNIAAYNYSLYMPESRISPLTCPPGTPAVKCVEARPMTHWSLRKPRIKHKIRTVGADIVGLQEVSHASVLIPPWRKIPFDSDVDVMMTSLRYRQTAKALKATDKRVKPNKSASPEKLRWTLGAKIYFKRDFFDDITVLDPWMTENQAMKAAAKMAGLPPIYAHTFSGSNRTEKVFPVVKLKVKGDKRNRSQEQIVVGNVHLRFDRNTVMESSLQPEQKLWVIDRITTGFSEFVAKRAFKGGSLQRVNLDAIPMVILGDLNADYTPTLRAYGGSEENPGQRINSPAEVLEYAGMVDARQIRPGNFDSPLTPEQMERYDTLTDPGKTAVNDYVFYKWRGPVKVGEFWAGQDLAWASDHKLVSATLQFYR